MTEQIFTFATSSDRTHESTHLLPTGMKAVPRISKAAIVFGPNASGKTNLVRALAIFRDLMLHSAGYSDAQFGERHTPFRFGPSVTQPTEFEVDVLLNRVRYRYALSYDSLRIRSERLLVYRTGKSQRWFDRRFDDATQSDIWSPFSPNFNGAREIWRKATRPTTLFLSTAALLNSEQLAPLVNWISHHLEILFPAETSDLNRIASRLQDAGFKSRMLALLRAVDIHVDDIRIADQEHGTSRRVMKFLHASKGALPVWMDAAFEAAGTRRLIGLFAPLLQAIQNGQLLVMDEFDAGLHPLVARFLVRLINDPRESTKGAQLLLTSHNTTLMDLEILRRDEIWLMQADDEHASNLLPLVRSSPRKHEQIAKNYLRGRYGAVPAIVSNTHEAHPKESEI